MKVQQCTEGRRLLYTRNEISVETMVFRRQFILTDSHFLHKTCVMEGRRKMNEFDITSCNEMAISHITPAEWVAWQQFVKIWSTSKIWFVTHFLQFYHSIQEIQEFCHLKYLIWVNFESDTSNDRTILRLVDSENLKMNSISDIQTFLHF